MAEEVAFLSLECFGSIARKTLPVMSISRHGNMEDMPGRLNSFWLDRRGMDMICFCMSGRDMANFYRLSV